MARKMFEAMINSRIGRGNKNMRNSMTNWTKNTSYQLLSLVLSMWCQHQKLQSNSNLSSLDHRCLMYSTPIWLFVPFFLFCFLHIFWHRLHTHFSIYSIFGSVWNKSQNTNDITFFGWIMLFSRKMKNMKIKKTTPTICFWLHCMQNRTNSIWMLPFCPKRMYGNAKATSEM